MGFYRENKVSPRKKIIQFFPLKSNAQVDDSVITNTQANLLRHLQSPTLSAAVFTCENEAALQKQKEKAFMYALDNDLSD